MSLDFYVPDRLSDCMCLPYAVYNTLQKQKVDAILRGLGFTLRDLDQFFRDLSHNQLWHLGNESFSKGFVSRDVFNLLDSLLKLTVISGFLWKAYPQMRMKTFFIKSTKKSFANRSFILFGYSGTTDSRPKCKKTVGRKRTLEEQCDRYQEIYDAPVYTVGSSHAVALKFDAAGNGFLLDSGKGRLGKIRKLTVPNFIDCLVQLDIVFEIAVMVKV